MTRIVTLTTDFGPGSGYVAEIKGRLLHAAGSVTLIDIAHDLPPHDIRAAAWLVGQACPAFPAGTLHIVVVDPGVGTTRRLVWAAVGGQQFLCPDNGLLSWLLQRSPPATARELPVAVGAAATFHGRDVLAPVALRLLAGASPESLGPPVADLVRLPWPACEETAAGPVGEVLHVDAFGNLVTNLPASLWPRVVAAGGLWVNGQAVTRLVRTYGEAAPGTPVVLVGSQGFIEVAVVQGHAAARLAVGPGARIAGCGRPTS